MSADMAPGPRVILGVSGGISAYKSVFLLRLLLERGARVRVVPTAGALHFVGAATWAGISGEPAHTTVWDDAEQIAHVKLGREAELVLVAPATADLLARAAAGRADDLLTNVLLTARCPVVFAPAMHSEMWQHPATQANVATLRARGAVVVDPASGRLAGPDSGVGRMPEPVALAELAWSALAGRGAPADLAGRHVLISAGGTREPIDPVRFIGNRSSGKQGYALARTALARGAEVTLVAANTSLVEPAGVKVVHAGTAAELSTAMHSAAAGADIVVMAAAVADFRPAAPSTQKLKKSAGAPSQISLVENADVLAELVAARRAGQVIVGFAAETEDVVANGQAKLTAKGADLLVVNEVGDGLAFDADDNAAVILGAGGVQVDVPRGSKDALAHRVWDEVARLL